MGTQQTTTTTEPTAPSLPEGGDDASLDARASALLEHLQADQKTAAREAQTPEAPAAKVEPEGTTPAEPAAEKTPEQVAEARRARIAARDAEVQRLAEEERARFAASRAKKQERQAPEAPAAPPSGGIAITDADSFFKAAEKLAIPPHQLAAWLTQQQDPTKAAQHAAKEALSPVEQKLAELERKQAERDERDRQAAEQAQVAQLVEQNHQILANHLESVKAEAPLAAAFQAKSPAKFRRAVESICDALPPGFTAQDVIDQLEEDLSDLQLNGSPAAPAAPSTAKPTPKPAAAKANVGNRLAAERATTVEDDGDDEGDLEERARKLKARLAAG